MSRAVKGSLLGILVVGVLLTVWVVILLRHGFSARSQPTAVETVVARTMRHLAVPMGARNMPNPVPPSSGNLAEARAHFADHCAICHGNDGKGATEIGKNLYPKAPDMTAPATQTLSDGEIFYIIKNGVRLTGMPAWGEDIHDDADSWKLVHFIRHLPQITGAELEEMSRLNPKSADELHEEAEEKQFLEGKPATERRKEHHHH